MTLPSTTQIDAVRAVRDHLKDNLRTRKDVHGITISWRNGAYTVVVAVDTPESTPFLPASINGVPIHVGKAPSLFGNPSRGGR